MRAFAPILAAALCIVGAVARAVDQEPILESKIVLGQVVGRIDHSGFDPVRKASVPIAIFAATARSNCPSPGRGLPRPGGAQPLAPRSDQGAGTFLRIRDRDACRGPPFSDGPAQKALLRAQGVGHPEAIRQFSSKC